jgi:acyl dehydratase
VALLSPLFTSLLEVSSCSMVVNYGIDRLRFPSAVPVGDQVRLSAKINDVVEVPNGVQLVADTVMTRAGGEKPVLVAQVLYRYFR